MYDAVVRNIDISKKRYVDGAWLKEFREKNGEISDISEKEYYLATIHRSENTDNIKKLKDIFTAFEKLDKSVLLPLHPRTRKLIEKRDIKLENVINVNPVIIY